MEDNNNKKNNNNPEFVRKSMDGIRRRETLIPHPAPPQTTPLEKPIILGPESHQALPSETSEKSIIPEDQPLEAPLETPLRSNFGNEVQGSTSYKTPVTSENIDESIEKTESTKEVSVKSSHKKLYVLIGLLIFFILLAGGSTIYFYKKSKKPVAEEARPVSEQQLEETLALVSKITLLPQNDEPVLAIVSDPSQLKADAFFIDSKVGDRVLIYPFIGRAFLYRPSTNQIINIMTFLPDSPESKALATSTTQIGNSVDKR